MFCCAKFVRPLLAVYHTANRAIAVLLTLGALLALSGRMLAEITVQNQIPSSRSVFNDTVVQNNAVTYSRQGLDLLNRERYAEAVEYFKAAIRLNPYSALSASLYNNLGIAYQQLGQYALAVASFQHAMRIQPSYELYYKNLVQTYSRAGGLRKAKAALTQVLEENPRDAEALYLLGLTYEELGDKEAGKYCFRKFVDLEPDALLAHAAREHLQ